MSIKAPTMVKWISIVEHTSDEYILGMRKGLGQLKNGVHGEEMVSCHCF